MVFCPVNEALVESSNIQIPSSKEGPTTKLQNDRCGAGLN